MGMSRSSLLWWHEFHLLEFPIADLQFVNPSSFAFPRHVFLKWQSASWFFLDNNLRWQPVAALFSHDPPGISKSMLYQGRWHLCCKLCFSAFHAFFLHIYETSLHENTLTSPYLDVSMKKAICCASMHEGKPCFLHPCVIDSLTSLSVVYLLIIKWPCQFYRHCLDLGRVSLLFELH